MEAGATLQSYVAVEPTVRICIGATVGEYSRLTPGVCVGAYQEVEPCMIAYLMDGVQIIRTNQGMTYNARAKRAVEAGHEKLLESLKGLVK